jgi:hypothetical protein
MKWVILSLAGLGALFIGAGVISANTGSWESRQAAPFPWLIGFALLTADFVIWLGYTMVKAIL